MMLRLSFYTVPITFHEKGDPEWQPPSEEGVHGYTDKQALEIHVLTTGVHPQMVADTVLHEVLHVLHMAGGAEADAKMSEELAVNAFAAGWKQLLTEDNDELLAYLTLAL